MHKTGSSSIQRYLMANRQFLEGQGYRVVDDHLTGFAFQKPGGIAVNSYGFAHFILRKSFASPIRLRHDEVEIAGSERPQRIADVNRILRDIAEQDHLIISAEAFSFLRTADERAVFDAVFDGLHVQPIIFFRERESWVESWTKQVSKLREKLERKELLHGVQVEGYEESVFDLGPNSTVGHERVIRDFFGPDGTYLSYEDALEKWGSTIPGFLIALGLEPEHCPDFQDYWFNKTRI